MGPEGLSGPPATTLGEHLLRAFFFSVHTLSTIGYGHIVAQTLTANVVTTVESVFGLIGIALTTGFVFARFSRPTAKILFSNNALVAPYRGSRGLMFRIANQRSTQIIELQAQVAFSRMERENGRRVRRFYQLPLEREKVVFFPLAWTIVHPIDKKSPFADVTKAECEDADAEILILLKGIDETFSQVVHTRSSFKAEELVWDAKFTDIHVRNESDDIIGIDLGKLSTYEPVVMTRPV